MIMEWKKAVLSTKVVYTATWRGSSLLLFQSPTDERWHMTADEYLVKQSWATARKAMNDVELRQQRIVKEAMKTAPKIVTKTAPRIVPVIPPSTAGGASASTV